MNPWWLDFLLIVRFKLLIHIGGKDGEGQKYFWQYVNVLKKIFCPLCKLCKQTGRRFQLRPNLSPALTNKVELHRNWVFFQRPLQQRRFILHFSRTVLFCSFILHFSRATKTQFFPATVTQVSDLPHALFQCCPSQISRAGVAHQNLLLLGLSK